MKVHRERENRVYIGKSRIPGAGRGLFAKTALAKGAGLEALGALVAAGSRADRCTSYADVYKFRVGRNLLIPTGYCGLINHSASPNLEKVIKGGRLFLRALRAIKKGEELLFSYSRYARKGFKR